MPTIFNQFPNLVHMDLATIYDFFLRSSASYSMDQHWVGLFEKTYIMCNKIISLKISENISVKEKLHLRLFIHICRIIHSYFRDHFSTKFVASDENSSFT